MRDLYPLYAHFRLNLNRTSIMAEENITTKVQQTYGTNFFNLKPFYLASMKLRSYVPGIAL